MFKSFSFLAEVRDAIERVAPRREALARREALELQTACCSLLLEVARLDCHGAERKHAAVASAMRNRFGVPEAELMPMIANVSRPENRLTSYYGPVALINRRWGTVEKTKLVEDLWTVAIADGEIDIYEDQLVRRLADLLYVGHADFILAKRRVQANGGGR